jgi:cellulose synthase/poly-beta-1,6-N-acetylglucosamine synthase-like glycosyltransferase
MAWIDIALTIAGLPALAASSYLAALAALSRRLPIQRGRPAHMKFDVVVPAHNEESQIAATVENLRSVDYPPALFRVLVVADNCTDRTASTAAASGAIVLTRTNAERRGKGYALDYAFEESLANGFADAVVVVDADTVVSRNLLTAFAARFERGAMAVQADYAVRNPRESWRTRMMTVAFAAFHGVRSLARERLGVSCGLRGNGMGFSRAVLKDHPHRAFSIVEDVEYGIQLGYAGVAVHYVDEARVFGQMVTGEQASRSQRERWESGRRALIREHAGPLLRAAWQRRNGLLLDLALDLLVPPLGELVAVVTVGVAICAGVGSLRHAVAPWIWGASATGVLLYVLRAWALSGVGAVGALDLLRAPFYILWKLMLRMRPQKRRRKDEWVRTTREVRM